MTTPTAPPATHYRSIAAAPPPIDVPVIVWWFVGEIVATFDGFYWRDLNRAILAEPILYWRALPPQP
jgi:hypothetical protein